MKRPSKKEIEAAVRDLRGKSDNGGPGPAGSSNATNKLETKKNSQRIRKQGVS